MINPYKTSDAVKHCYRKLLLKQGLYRSIIFTTNEVNYCVLALTQLISESWKRRH